MTTKIRVAAGVAFFVLGVAVVAVIAQEGEEAAGFVRRRTRNILSSKPLDLRRLPRMSGAFNAELAPDASMLTSMTTVA